MDGFVGTIFATILVYSPHGKNCGNKSIITKRLHLILLLYFCLGLPQAISGGPLLVNDSGLVALWDNSSSISLDIESGSCSSFSNSEMVDKLENILTLWEDINNINLDLSFNDDTINEDVTLNNYSDFIDSDTDLSPIIFDNEGDIIESIFGSGSSETVLGFAGILTVDETETEILRGYSIMNCLCVESSDCTVSFEEEELDYTILHEFGHLLGLDHTQVNQALVDAECDETVSGDCDDVPVMFPTLFDSGEELAVKLDDQIAALTLYGSSSWDDNLCIIEGSLTDVNGNPLRCADVQALTNDTADTIATVSGYYATKDLGECSEGCGDFILRGLDPDKEYTIKVVPIDASWVGGSSVGPCTTKQDSGIVEENVAVVSDCTGGETTDLGTLSTQSTSTLDNSSSDSTDSSDDGSSSSADCGVGKDFSNCNPIISCSLNQAKNPPIQIGVLLLFGLFWGLFGLYLGRNGAY